MDKTATKDDINKLDKKFDANLERLDKKIDRLELKIDEKFDEVIEHLTGVINKFAAHVEERFDRLESRVENLEEKMTDVQGELRYQNKRYDRLVEIISV